MINRASKRNIFFVFFLLSFFFSTFLFVNTQKVFASTCTISSTLRLGSKGEHVKCLQLTLNLQTDGIFGPKTKAALIAWQTKEGLVADGIFGPKSNAVWAANQGNVGVFPVGCTSASGYSLVTGYPCTALPANLFAPTGCTTVAGYSPVTGGACQSLNLQTGCTSTVGFSPTTGQSCVIPVGCFSAVGYSPTTGVSCSSDSVMRIRSGIVSAHPHTISTAAIAGVTVPAGGATPTAVISDTTEYTATISWVGNPAVFTGNTAYTATITITPKTGYTLVGVPVNFFTVSGAVATNSIDSGIVSAVFPATPLIQLTVAPPVLTTTKGYDGDDTAAVTAGALSGVTSGDTVTVSALATYDTSDVDTGKTITIVYTLGGADAGKYIKPINGTNTNGEITAKPITVTADSGQTKVFGESDPVFTYTPSPALIGADVFTGTLSRVTGESVGTYAITQNDLSAGTNYSITFVSDDFLITAAPATYIPSAGVTGFTAPVTGVTPQLFGTLTAVGATYHVSGLTWSPTNNPFLGGQVYTATIVLTSDAGYKFPVAGIAVPTADGGGTVSAGVTGGGDASGNTLTFTSLFPATVVPLAIGDSYQGGKIAYILQAGDPGYNSGVTHGLIAATSDQGMLRWFNGSYIVTNATGTVLGTGLANTNTIIVAQGTIATSYAAGLARAYAGGGYSDWYLPSKDELNKFFLNKIVIGGFNTSEFYWSSSEISNIYAWIQWFDDGGLPAQAWKDNPWAFVRAVRSF